MSRRIVLAYTGSLQTSMAIRFLAEAHDAEVVTLTLDLGQGRDLEKVRNQALASGAVRAHVLDVREEFAQDFVLPVLRVGAWRGGRYPVGEVLAWPLIARKLVDVGSFERVNAIAHCCTVGDQKRIEGCLAALEPMIRVMAAGCEGVAQHAHANLWLRARAVNLPSVEMPDSPAYVEIAFEQGVPVAVNRVRMRLIELIESLSVIAGQHGVGRIDTGRRESGQPGYQAYESPAAVVLYEARTTLDAAVLPPDLLRLKQDRAIAYERLVSDGLWFTEDRETMDALNVKMEEWVTGSVRIKLFKGKLLMPEVVDMGCAEVLGI